jgi:hypothetical protein
MNHDVITNREGARPDRVGRSAGSGVPMDLHPAEIMTESRLYRSPCRAIEWMPG